MTVVLMAFSLGEYITRIRDQKGWGTRELARRAGINHETIRKIETGDTKSPGIEAIVSISKALNIPIINLILAYQGIDPDESNKISPIDPEQVMMEAIKQYQEWRESQGK